MKLWLRKKVFDNVLNSLMEIGSGAKLKSIKLPCGSKLMSNVSTIYYVAEPLRKFVFDIINSSHPGETGCGCPVDESWLNSLSLAPVVLMCIEFSLLGL
ncbi:hypothetical protein AVEN_258773-1 [Araneus ventricosus]|uniref:Uncharacterized protein n=1 Tax=Araneus ventricosus TaxID=182803 RepID=A0A4Y2D0I3_ARAVE|nr:hypothetical protein AVEN_258773-1 [Araneus ventricosus]